jgi:hypothetical protein
MTDAIGIDAISSIRQRHIIIRMIFDVCDVAHPDSMKSDHITKDSSSWFALHRHSERGTEQICDPFSHRWEIHSHTVSSRVMSRSGGICSIASSIKESNRAIWASVADGLRVRRGRRSPRAWQAPVNLRTRNAITALVCHNRRNTSSLSASRRTWPTSSANMTIRTRILDRSKEQNGRCELNRLRASIRKMYCSDITVELREVIVFDRNVQFDELYKSADLSITNR